MAGKILAGWCISAAMALLLNLAVPAYDEAACESANAKAYSTASAYQAARTAYDYCIRYGDTSGTGYGSTNCDSAYSSMQAAKDDYDNAVSEQWQYCY